MMGCCAAPFLIAHAHDSGKPVPGEVVKQIKTQTEKRFVVRKCGEIWFAVDVKMHRVWTRTNWRHAFNCLLFEYGSEYK